MADATKATAPRLVSVRVPEALIKDYRAARAKVARAALPTNVWTAEQYCVDLRNATFALAEAASQPEEK